MPDNSNKIVHAMWVGAHLSRLELLTLHSFLRHGHDVHLWTYDDLSKAPLPPGVRLRDAAQVIARRDVFTKAGRDRETGVGNNSFGAPFSDLFRFKLLLEHGGIWVDMDVTCLRPFDFPGDYAFRPHRLGVVGSVLKCPKGSTMMRRVYEETVRTVDRNADYLAPNRILSAHVAESGLMGHVVSEMTNPDDWFRYIKPLIEKPTAIPDAWYGVHWINEMWRTLRMDGGYYRDRKVLDYAPDKDRPADGSTLWELYRSYGLIDPQQRSRLGGRSRLQRPLRAPQPVMRLAAQPPRRQALNIVIPSFVRGGAERITAEVVTTLAQNRITPVNLYVRHDARRKYDLPKMEGLNVVSGNEEHDTPTNMRMFALSVLRSGSPVVITHLLRVEELRHFWDFGIMTIPVIHNARPSWHDDPKRLNVPGVPLVIAVADAVADELRAHGLKRPVVTLRHALQRAFLPADLARHRKEIRDQHGVGDRTLLIGMVGQFKAQKAYTRAVRVLHRMQERCETKLMILGGWDQSCGGSAEAYQAACRRAVDLEVIADMITVGNVRDVVPYLAAFDVFLSTSIYEGLSVALLEAIQAGCPIVTADAGGNREVVPESAALIPDGNDMDAYVEAILTVTKSSTRLVPARPPDADLIPELWSLIARYGIEPQSAFDRSHSGTLFLASDLAGSSRGRRLTALVCELSKSSHVAVCVLRDDIDGELRAQLDAAHVQLCSASAPTLAERTRLVLDCLELLKLSSLCFWGAPSEERFMLAKVLTARRTVLVDVCADLQQFADLAAPQAFQRRLALSFDQYLQRLRAVVSPVRQKTAPRQLAGGRLRIIPDGSPRLPSFVPTPPAEFLLPPERDARLVLGTVCMCLSPASLGYLERVAAKLSSTLKGASLNVLANQESLPPELRGRAQVGFVQWRTEPLFFTCDQSLVQPFLTRCRLFLLLPGRETRIDALLDARSMGIPVVADAAGAASGFVHPGTGVVVAGAETMAVKAAALLKDESQRARMAAAARAHSHNGGSLEAMALAYRNVLEDPAHVSASAGRRRNDRRPIGKAEARRIAARSAAPGR